MTYAVRIESREEVFSAHRLAQRTMVIGAYRDGYRRGRGGASVEGYGRSYLSRVEEHGHRAGLLRTWKESL